MPTSQPEAPEVLDDGDIARLQELLDELPAPLQPLDVSALDGFLCGLLLQPDRVDDDRLMRWVLDVEGRAPPAGCDLATLRSLVLQRRAQLAAAIHARQWFDPWVFELDEDAGPSLAVLPWVAGFAAAMERFPALLRLDDDRLLEPLALLYMHFDPADLEEADALGELIETLEPPRDLGEAVQDIVRSLMLIADVVQPIAVPSANRKPRPKPGQRRRR